LERWQDPLPCCLHGIGSAFITAGPFVYASANAKIAPPEKGDNHNLVLTSLKNF